MWSVVQEGCSRDNLLRTYVFGFFRIFSQSDIPFSTSFIRRLIRIRKRNIRLEKSNLKKAKYVSPHANNFSGKDPKGGRIRYVRQRNMSMSKEQETEKQEVQETVRDAEVVEETESGEEKVVDPSKKVKNLSALLILVAGLFVGSLFVDVLQLVTKQGFSLRAIKQADVIEAGGKTWVAYSDPKVGVKVLTDAACKECNADEAVVSLRRALPTIEVTQVDVDSPEGKALIAKSKVNVIPAFFFDSSIENTQVFASAGPLFGDKLDNGLYVVDALKIGMQPGKFLTLPTIADNDLKTGNADAKVKVVEFSDWQCPYCKAMQPAIKQMLADYQDKVTYVYKQFPLTSIHPQAENAALAVECANEQGKWFEYGDYLFVHQDEWGKVPGTQKFKDYARALKLDVTKFGQCLDGKQYAEHVTKNTEEGSSFGISGTPGFFINSRFIGGYVSADEFKKALDEELAKVQ